MCACGCGHVCERHHFVSPAQHESRGNKDAEDCERARPGVSGFGGLRLFWLEPMAVSSVEGVLQGFYRLTVYENSHRISRFRGRTHCLACGRHTCLWTDYQSLERSRLLSAGTR